MKIDIGGGTAPALGYINLDPVHGEGEWKRLAQDTPWPVADNEVEALRASHVVEHVPAGHERIAMFNEAWRVLRPGGQFEIVVPLFPSWQAVADPTHVSFWVKESFQYFTGEHGAQANYGMSLWKTVRYWVVAGWEGHWIGTPVK